MKVQLIVVRGKPEGKVIPLSGPKFKIGRGETCHLRPNSEQVSREHAEFSIDDGVVTVADLGSRNGTLVNGKALTEPCVLKDGNLVQVGPLTFAVQITGAPAAAAPRPATAKPAAQTPTPAAASQPAAKPQTQARPQAKAPEVRSAPEDVLNEDIDSWLVGEATGSAPDAPTQVYGGDTITIAAFKDAASTPAKPAPVEEEEEEEEEENEEDEVIEDSLDEDEEEEEEEEEEEAVEEFLDESNPFYAAKKAQKDAEKAAKAGGGGGAGGANQQFKDSSDAASEILSKLMERRRASK